MSPRQHGHLNTSLGLDEPCEIDERAALVLQPGVQAFSGARFEHVALADGRRLVLKRLPPEGDWLTRVTGGAGARACYGTAGSWPRWRRRSTMPSSPSCARTTRMWS